MVLEVGQLRLMSWDELKNGIVNGLTNAATGTVNILGYLLIALTYLIIPAAIAGIVVWIVLASIRRKRKRDGKQPPHNPQPSAGRAQGPELFAPALDLPLRLNAFPVPGLKREDYPPIRHSAPMRPAAPAHPPRDRVWGSSAGQRFGRR